jgi:hypothetical protein
VALGPSLTQLEELLLVADVCGVVWLGGLAMEYRREQAPAAESSIERPILAPPAIDPNETRIIGTADRWSTWAAVKDSDEDTSGHRECEPPQLTSEKAAVHVVGSQPPRRPTNRP